MATLCGRIDGLGRGVSSSLNATYDGEGARGALPGPSALPHAFYHCLQAYRALFRFDLGGGGLSAVLGCSGSRHDGGYSSPIEVYDLTCHACQAPGNAA